MYFFIHLSRLVTNYIELMAASQLTLQKTNINDVGIDDRG